MRFVILAIYLGIGAMLHAMFVGPQFDWSSAWTFGWLFGWPIALLIAGLSFWAALVALVVGIGLLVAGWEWLKTIAEWRERRRAR